MKFSKIAYILLVFWLVGVVVEGCGCPDPSHITCSVSSLKLAHLDDGNWTNNPVPRSHYGILIEFEMKHIAKIQPSASLIRSAHAMEQCRDVYIPKDTITSIQFFTELNFDASHPAGTDISDHFMAMKVNVDWPAGTETYEDISLADALKRWCDLNRDGYIEPLSCVLVTPPDAGTYIFRVVVGLSDGRELEQSIKAILE